MMTDDEIIAVVQAHKEGKKLQWQPINDCQGWLDHPEGKIHWHFQSIRYRVAPEPQELWLQYCGDKSGLWQEKFKGLGIHFIEVIE